MDTDTISLLGLILSIFGFGVAVGKVVEKINRISSKIDNKSTQNKNNRP